MTNLTRNCAGMPRRDFLQLGIGAVLGLGFSDILRLRANAASAQTAPKSSGKQVNCILIWLDGGPSHYETFDPKPEAPIEFRGQFDAIATKVAGVRFSQHMQRLASIADKLAVIRSIRHDQGNHGRGGEGRDSRSTRSPATSFPCHAIEHSLGQRPRRLDRLVYDAVDVGGGQHARDRGQLREVPAAGSAAVQVGAEPGELVLDPSSIEDAADGGALAGVSLHAGSVPRGPPERRIAGIGGVGLPTLGTRYQ